MRLGIVIALIVPVSFTAAASAQDAPLPPLPAPDPSAPESPPAAPSPPAAAPASPPAAAPPLAPASPAETSPVTAAAGAYLHDGFYFRFAVGPSYTSLRGTGPAGPASTSGGGISLALALGGTVAEGLVIGGVWDIAVGSGSPSSLAVPAGTSVAGGFEGLSLFGDWYPDPRGGWHAGASLGFGLTLLTVGSSTLGAGDLTGSLFGGYDWWIGPQWSMGVLIKATGGTRTELRDLDDQTDGGYALSAGSIAVEWSILLH